MFLTHPVQTAPRAGSPAPVQLFEGDTMLDPKWAITAVALGIFALAASFDAQLGLAVGIALVIIAAIALWVRVRFGGRSDTNRSDRSALAQRFQRLGDNRRAAQQASEASSQDRTDPRENS